ncbi:MAG: flagellin [Leptospirales bacterium]
MIIQTGISDYSSQKLRWAQYAANSQSENNTDSTSEKVKTTNMQVDKADISVHGRMKARLMSLREVRNNIKSGIEMLETADKGVRTILTILEKIKDLAVQSINGIYSKDHRQLIQVQVSELIDEVDRIVESTEYNSKTLLDGDYSRHSRKASMWMQIGPNMHERERIFISTMSALNLRLSNVKGEIASVSTPKSAQETLDTLEYSLYRVKKQLADIEGYNERFKETQIKVNAEIELLEKNLGETEKR